MVSGRANHRRMARHPTAEQRGTNRRARPRDSWRSKYCLGRISGRVDPDHVGTAGIMLPSDDVRCLTVTPGRAGSTALADLPEPEPAPEMLLVLGSRLAILWPASCGGRIRCRASSVPLVR